MAEETRALQIRLAQLQSDIRVYTTAMFASIAAIVPLMIPVYSYGITFWETMTISLPKMFVSFLFIGVAIALLYVFYRFYSNVEALRTELNNLSGSIVV